MAKPKRRTSLNPLSANGVEPITPTGFSIEDRDPTNDDVSGYLLGHEWLNESSQEVFKLVAKKGTVATWVSITSMSFSIEFDGDSGTATPNASMEVNFVGDTNIMSIGSGNTLTYHLKDDITVTDITVDSLTVTSAATLSFLDRGVVQVDASNQWFADEGTDGQLLISADASAPSWANITATDGTLSITNGANSLVVDTADPLTLTTLTVENLTVTNSATFPFLNRGVVQADASGVLFSDEGTDGQLLISSSSGAPAWAALASSDASITITNGANSVDLSFSGATLSGFNYVNIGMEIDTGAQTFTIFSASGAALSASNPGRIKFYSKSTPGTLVEISVTSNVSIDWSDMDGNIFGTEGSKAWDEDMPLYVYAVLNDAENDCTFGLARVPHHKGSGSSGAIGTPSTANADTDMSFFLLESVTIANYDDNPVTLLGSVIAMKDGSDSWTFSALSSGTTGIGAYCLGVVFNFVAGQMGSNGARWFWSQLGGLPTVNSGGYIYNIDLDGYFSFNAVIGNYSTHASGIARLYLMLPIEGTPVDRAGLWINSRKAIGFEGPWRGVYETSILANGYYGVKFVKNDNREMRASNLDFSFPNLSPPNFAGSMSLMLNSNSLP